MEAIAARLGVIRQRASQRLAALARIRERVGADGKGRRSQNQDVDPFG